MITRRSLIAGFATMLAAPAIVRASSLMPVKPWLATLHGTAGQVFTSNGAGALPTFRFRISGTDAYGNYQEEFVDDLPDQMWTGSTALYRTVEIEMLEPIFIPIDANIYADLA